MNIKKYIIFMIILVILNISFGEQLSQSEINDVVDFLTKNSSDLWIPYGMMKADCLMYKAQTDEIKKYSHTLKTDGGRYYWKLELKRYDPGKTFNKGRTIFNAADNREKVQIWDGEKFYLFNVGLNSSTVFSDGTHDLKGLKGPIKAGCIPFGFGLLSKDQLLDSEIKGKVIEENGKSILALDILRDDGIRIDLKLIPEKGFSVTYYSLEKENVSLSIENKKFENYSGFWVPGFSSRKTFRIKNGEKELYSYKNWDFKKVKVEKVSESAYVPDYTNDTQVEYRTSESKKSFIYRHYDGVNVEAILDKKLSMQDSDVKYNCAMASVEYVLSQFGMDSDVSKTEKLKNEKFISIKSILETFEEKGLHAEAVKTEVGELMNVGDCQIILHLPKEKHFLVLEYASDKHVWLVDLTSTKFYNRYTVESFQKRWKDGTAILVSKKPITDNNNLTKLTDNQILNTKGALPVSMEDFDCTEIVQEYLPVLCEESCLGSIYFTFYERWGCASEPGEGGNCEGYKLPRYVYATCVWDVYLECDLESEWHTVYMRACN